MKNKTITKEILNKLKSEYGKLKCELNYCNSFQFLIAVILSAQCTDK